MKKAINDFENDSDAYVAVLHGIGGNFCSGFDLNAVANSESETSFLSELETGLMVS